MSKTTTEKIESQISPDKYSSILSGLELKSIALSSCEVKSNRELLLSLMRQQSPIPVDISENASFTVSDDTVVVEHNYSIISRQKKNTLLSMKVSYTLTFQSTEEFTDEFFTVFQQLGLPLYTWSYLREFAASMTGRMDLPKLQLGLRHAPRL